MSAGMARWPSMGLCRTMDECDGRMDAAVTVMRCVDGRTDESDVAMHVSRLVSVGASASASPAMRTRVEMRAVLFSCLG